MPRKVQYSREMIIDSAIEMVREKGPDCINARDLGEYMGCSVNARSSPPSAIWKTSSPPCARRSPDSSPSAYVSPATRMTVHLLPNVWVCASYALHKTNPTYTN